jgi:DNA-binding MarR family transcriptional regulator
VTLGLVERRTDPADGRARLIVPTPDGSAAMRAGLDVALAIHQRWERLLGPEKLAQLMVLLQELTDRLREESRSPEQP